MRRGEDRAERNLEADLDGLSLRLRDVDERDEFVELGRLHGPAEGALAEFFEDLPDARGAGAGIADDDTLANGVFPDGADGALDLDPIDVQVAVEARDLVVIVVHEFDRDDLRACI